MIIFYLFLFLKTSYDKIHKSSFRDLLKKLDTLVKGLAKKRESSLLEVPKNLFIKRKTFQTKIIINHIL